LLLLRCELALKALLHGDQLDQDPGRLSTPKSRRAT
jgi:hypothetical protein